MERKQSPTHASELHKATKEIQRTVGTLCVSTRRSSSEFDAQAEGDMAKNISNLSVDSELTGMGELPFTWYKGCVLDLGMFGEDPLETDEVASSPEVHLSKHRQHVGNRIVKVGC